MGDLIDYFMMVMGLLEIIYDRFNEEYGKGKMPVDIFANIISLMFINYMKKMGGQYGKYFIRF